MFKLLDDFLLFMHLILAILRYNFKLVFCDLFYFINFIVKCIIILHESLPILHLNRSDKVVITVGLF